jgi:hypothetical protein
MEDYPYTLKELESRFSDKTGCGEYLYRLRQPEGLLVNFELLISLSIMRNKTICATEITTVNHGI